MSEDFGDVLRRIRKERHLTLEQMSKILHTSKQVLSRYERNERTPKITVAAKYAEILDVPLEELLGYEYHEEDPATMYLREMMEQHEVELTWFAEVFMNATPKDQKQIMKILDSFYYTDGDDE